MRKNIIIVLIVISTLIVIWSLGDRNYNSLEELEKLLLKHEITYISKPTEIDKRLDFAIEQRKYEIDDSDIYVYIVDKSEIEKANYIVSNELLKDYTVADTNYFLFAYSNKNSESIQRKLYKVINKIKDSEIK